MRIMIADTWLFFCITFGVVQLTSFIMALLGRNFFTHDGTTRQFTMMDLELAPNGKEINNTMRGIFSLPPDQVKKVVRALKRQLYVDFLFMPAAYGSIFLLCMETSSKLTTGIGQNIFALLAWGQILPWACDIVENFFLLSRISPNPTKISDASFRAYKINEWLKWGIALTGAVFSIASNLYFWLTGDYTAGSLVYLIVLIGELLVFMWLARRFVKKPGVSE